MANASAAAESKKIDPEGNNVFEYADDRGQGCKEKEEEKQSPPNSSSRHLSENVRKSDKYKSGTCIRLYIK